MLVYRRNSEPAEASCVDRYPVIADTGIPKLYCNDRNILKRIEFTYIARSRIKRGPKGHISYTYGASEYNLPPLLTDLRG